MDQIMRWLQQADRLLLTGQLPKAETLCRRALNQEPRNQAALMLLGTVCLHQAKKAEAVERYLEAAALEPDTAASQTALGMASHVQGQYEQAEMYFQLALELEPGAEETLALLKNTRLALARTLETSRPDGISALPLTRPQRGSSALVPPVHRQPVQLRNAAEREFDLGVEHLKVKQYTQAEVKFRKAITLRPNYPDAFNNLGLTLRMLGRLEESVRAYKNALELRPDNPQVYDNLGITLQALDRFTEAEASFAKALELQPNEPLTHSNLGVLYLAQNRCEEAVARFRQSLALRPGSADVQMNLGMTLLKMTRFAEGWNAYESRMNLQAGVLDTLAPRWDGKPLEGRTVLIYAEQGLGDAIQYARYLPLVKARSGRVVLVCQAGLKGLLSTLEGVDELVEGTRSGAATLPPFHAQASLLSLPALFETRLDTIPASIPYLHPDPEKSRFWQERFASVSGFKVGIVWAGNPEYGNDRTRSCRLADFAPLFDLPDVHLVSLQMGEPASQIAAFRAAASFTNLSGEPRDFTDTAAIVANLDLVISVDTSVAHLAGAIGAPVWTALSFAADWRWMLDRSDTPWYPTMRLFRQPQPADWQSVFTQVADTLREKII